MIEIIIVGSLLGGGLLLGSWWLLKWLGAYGRIRAFVSSHFQKVSEKTQLLQSSDLPTSSLSMDQSLIAIGPVHPANGGEGAEESEEEIGAKWAKKIEELEEGHREGLKAIREGKIGVTGRLQEVKKLRIEVINELHPDKYPVQEEKDIAHTYFVRILPLFEKFISEIDAEESESWKALWKRLDEKERNLEEYSRQLEEEWKKRTEETKAAWAEETNRRRERYDAIHRQLDDNQEKLATHLAANQQELDCQDQRLTHLENLLGVKPGPSVNPPSVTGEIKVIEGGVPDNGL